MTLFSDRLLEPGETRPAWSAGVSTDLADGWIHGGMDVNNIVFAQLYFRLPGHGFVIHVDNVRLERNLGAHFDRLMTIVEVAERFSGGAGELARKAAQLRQDITATRSEFENLPFSRENMERVLARVSELRKRVFDNLSLLPRLEDLIRSTNQAGLFRDVGPDAYYQQLKAQLAIAAARVDEASRVAQAADGHSFAVGWTTCAETIRPYGQPFAGTFGRAELSAGRNEREGVQLVVIPTGENLSGLTLTAGEFLRSRIR